MHAPPKADVPIIEAAQLADADCILFGFPARYGMMAAQMKAFFDSTGGLWRTQALAGKPAGFFFSTGSQGGGQETAAYVPHTHSTRSSYFSIVNSTNGMQYRLYLLGERGVASSGRRSVDKHEGCL